MKYIVMDQKNGDLFTDEFETKEEAIAHADRSFGYLTDTEKKQREIFCVLESANPDEDAEDHLDGRVVKDYLKS